MAKCKYLTIQYETRSSAIIKIYASLNLIVFPNTAHDFQIFFYDQYKYLLGLISN